jgi:uncharacterized Fe-S cluster protein YjdI
MENLPEEIKKYNKENFNVVWQPHLCSHSANCVRGLPGVFNPKNKPWISVDGASGDEIRNQVGMCPSGALSIEEIK